MKYFLIGLLVLGNAQAQSVTAHEHSDQIIARQSGINSEAWHAAKDATGVQRVNVECGENYIDPPEIVVQQGVPVVLSVRAGRNVTNREVLFSNHKRNLDKKPITISFTPTASGHFPLVCSSLTDGRKRKEGKLHVVR
jgi:hypothetical protein